MQERDILINMLRIKISLIDIQPAVVVDCGLVESSLQF